jgi:hypothetical protein
MIDAHKGIQITCYLIVCLLMLGYGIGALGGGE